MPSSKRRRVDPPEKDSIPQSPPPGSPTSSTATLTSPPRTGSHSVNDLPSFVHNRGSSPASQPPCTPAVPSRYPNLETHTQLARAVSRPKAFRRTKSRYEDCLWVMQKGEPWNAGSETGRGELKCGGRGSVWQGGVQGSTAGDHGGCSERGGCACRGADRHGQEVRSRAPSMWTQRADERHSLCFQVPAVADQYGISIVISPLLCGSSGRLVGTDADARVGAALMKNQIEGLRAKGVKVHMLCSETSFAEKLEVRTSAW